MEIRKLNALRGLAALIVVVSHYSNSTGLMGGLLGFGGGQFGVMLFFMLSGFLMAYLYLDREFTPAAVAEFAAARIARIIPLYYFLVFASYALCKSGAGPVLYEITDKSLLAAHLLLLFGGSAFWTIPPEMQFYALFVLLWWLYSKRPVWLFAAMVVLVIACSWRDFTNWETQFARMRVQASIVNALPYLLCGVALGWLYRTWQVPLRWRSHAYAFAPLALLIFYPNIYSLIFGHDHAMWREPMLVAAVALVFFAVAFLTPDDNPLFCNRAGDFLGKISFSIYLLHYPLLGATESYARDNPVLYPCLYFAGVMLVSTISYYVIEAPARGALRTHARKLIDSCGRARREQLSRG